MDYANVTAAGALVTAVGSVTAAMLSTRRLRQKSLQECEERIAKILSERERTRR